MVSPGAPGGVRDPCPITWVPINIHSAATRPVRIRAGFFIVSSSTGILEALEGLGKGKDVSPVIGTTPTLPPMIRLSERSGRTACPRPERGMTSLLTPRPRYATVLVVKRTLSAGFKGQVLMPPKKRFPINLRRTASTDKTVGAQTYFRPDIVGKRFSIEINSSPNAGDLVPFLPFSSSRSSCTRIKISPCQYRYGRSFRSINSVHA